MISQAPKGLCLASSDDFTRQRCMRIIQAASAGGASSSLRDIASAAALTPDLLNMKSVSAIKAVLSALGIAWNDPCLMAAGFDLLLSLKTPGFDLAAFRAAGCSWADIRAAGFTAADVSAAGCDLATATLPRRLDMTFVRLCQGSALTLSSIQGLIRTAVYL